VAKEALLLGDDDAQQDISSCGTFALHCRRSVEGAKKDDDAGSSNGGEAVHEEEGEFAVMVGIGAISPYLHREEAYLQHNPLLSIKNENDEGSTAGSTIGDANNDNNLGSTYLPLTIEESTSSNLHNPSSTSPLSILSPTLVVGTGGKAIDSTILLRRAMEIALSMYANDCGGVDWFVSHSLEGTLVHRGNYDGGDEEDDRGDSPPSIMGGAAGADATTLARRVADMARGSTQSLGGRYGRMLSSSLLAVGARTPPTNLHRDNTNRSNNHIHPEDNDDTLVLWRVDPTGQFWRMHASAVGRGAANAESELLKRVRSWRMQNSKEAEEEDHPQRNNGDGDDSEKKDDDVRQDDIRAYLGSLSPHEAVKVATDCLVDGILAGRMRMTQQQQQQLATSSEHHGANDPSILQRQLEWGLRKRVRAVVIRSKNSYGRSKPFVEIVGGI